MVAANGAIKVRPMPKKPKGGSLTTITDGYEANGLNHAARADAQAGGSDEMKRAALILGLVSGVTLSLGIYPGSLMVIGIILLVFVAWGRGLAGKRAFDQDSDFISYLIIPTPLCLYTD